MDYMDYLPLITKDEQEIICDMIEGAFFKESFIKYPKQFNRIKPGFRASKLSEQMALDIAKGALKHNLIQYGINSWLNIAIKDMQSQCKKKEAEGKTHLEALAVTLIDSCFSSYPELYCKLSGEELSEDQKQHLIHEIERQNFLRTEAATQFNALNQEIESLREQLHTEQEASKERNRTIARLEQELASAQKRLAPLELTKTELTDESQLKQYIDATPTNLLEIASICHVSLCEAKADYNARVWLYRYADIDCNGTLSIFSPNPDLPSLFANRNKLYHKDGSDKIGTIGVWSWTAIERDTDPSKDFIESSFQKEIRPIEIIIVCDCQSVEQLIDVLKKGYPCKPRCSRVMFSADITKYTYAGVLCDEHDFIITNDMAILEASVEQLPVYDFSSDSILKLKNGLQLYYRVYAGTPNRIYQVKSITDVVKSVIIDSLSWKNYIQHCTVKSEYQKFKELLKTISNQSTIEKIQTACHCTAKTAETLLNDFITKADQYINSDCIEDAVLRSLIDNDEMLTSRIKDLLKNEWEQEQAALMTDAQSRLDTINADIDKANQRLAAVNEEYNRSKSQEAKIRASIAEQERLADNVERIVEERIQSARKNVAEFIADMAFTGTPTGSQDIKCTAAANYNVICQSAENADIEVYTSWDDAFQTVCYCMEEAGIASDYTDCVAAYLCAAYILKQPLMIVGANSNEIVNALRSALFCGKYGRLYCAGSFDKDILHSIGQDNEQLVEITDLFSVEWMNHLPELIANRNIFFVATHPFPEDIQVEPKSLYNYVLPLFTDLFVDCNASGNYEFGCPGENLKEYKSEKANSSINRIVSRLHTNMLVKNKLQSILDVMHSLYPEMTADKDFLFGVFQYAYAVMDMETINHERNSDTLSKETKRLLTYLLGEIE